MEPDGGRRLDLPPGRRLRPGHAGPAACVCRTAPRAISCGSIPGEEWLYVLDGRLRLALGDTVHELSPGDSAHFDSLTPHRIAAADPRRGRAALRPHPAAEPATSIRMCLTDTPERPPCHQHNEEGKFPRGLVIRLFAYLVAGHLFAGLPLPAVHARRQAARHGTGRQRSGSRLVEEPLAQPLPGLGGHLQALAEIARRCRPRSARSSRRPRRRYSARASKSGLEQLHHLGGHRGRRSCRCGAPCSGGAGRWT